MNKIVAMLIALMATLFTVNALAYTPPPSPAPASWISDNSHVLSDEAHARLDAKLKQINQSSANEIAALILPTLDGADIADVGDITAKTWGVGKKGLDNGVLVVLAMKEHKSRISTGKGVEGDLPDLKTQDILVGARPYLRSNNVEGALAYIFDSSAKAIANHRADVAAGKTGGGSRPACDVSGGVGASSGGGWILLLVAGGAIALVWLLAASAKRRREEAEAERLAAAQRQEARRRQAEQREAEREAERKRKAALTKNTPVVAIPSVPRPTVTHSAPRPSTRVTPSVTPVAPVVAASVAASVAADAARHKRQAEEAEARRARERADEDRRRREREDEDRRSSYSSSSSSSSSSFDWGGSSSSSDSGSFGGGDSGGGGSSGDW